MHGGKQQPWIAHQFSLYKFPLGTEKGRNWWSKPWKEIKNWQRHTAFAKYSVSLFSSFCLKIALLSLAPFIAWTKFCKTKERHDVPFDPVKRRSSVESTQSTALVWPSAIWIQWSGEDLTHFEGGNGLIMPLHKEQRKTVLVLLNPLLHRCFDFPAASQLAG